MRAPDTQLPELIKQEKQEIVQGGYFKAQFLFDFPTAAYYTLLVQASIIDETGVMWKSKPTYSVTVLAGSEEVIRQQQQKA